jgi:hypothetical protein
VRKGSFAYKKLEHKNPEGPDIGLGTIHIFDEAFRGHIDGRPNVDIFKFRASGLSKAEVSNFSLTVVNKYVTDLDIPVYDAMVGQIEQTFKNSLNIGCRLFLSHVLFGLEFGLKVSLVA